MWLAFATLFGFTIEGGGGDKSRNSSDGNGIPESFRHTDHLFYGQRCVNVDIDDDDADTMKKKTIKWVGHRRKSPQWSKPS